eukprot:TRINITY_DN437_c0_g1_i1.p1 TRINITY_DN437_c0_g1~~TRINITY_DN437_c0_g1_i1.p1  ORF type:complete len:641 (-),score=96.73 TRINITY_DN437_c0_g1_i1:104-2026(-)
MESSEGDWQVEYRQNYAKIVTALQSGHLTFTKPFSADEQQRFLSALESVGEQLEANSWDHIATTVGRSVSDVLAFAREYTIQDQGGFWSVKEDEILEQAVKQLAHRGEIRLELVAPLLPHKRIEDIQCRYQFLLSDITSIGHGTYRMPVWDSSDVKTPRRAKGVKGSDDKRKAAQAWSAEEHKQFLLGLERCGKGAWRQISRGFVVTRTPAQVASHAQKFFIRQQNADTDTKRRPSIHDIRSADQVPRMNALDPRSLQEVVRENVRMGRKRGMLSPSSHVMVHRLEPKAVATTTTTTVIATATTKEPSVNTAGQTSSADNNTAHRGPVAGSAIPIVPPAVMAAPSPRQPAPKLDGGLKRKRAITLSSTPSQVALYAPQQLTVHQQLQLIQQESQRQQYQLNESPAPPPQSLPPPIMPPEASHAPPMLPPQTSLTSSEHPPAQHARSHVPMVPPPPPTQHNLLPTKQSHVAQPPSLQQLVQQAAQQPQPLPQQPQLTQMQHQQMQLQAQPTPLQQQVQMQLQPHLQPFPALAAIPSSLMPSHPGSTSLFPPIAQLFTIAGQQEQSQWHPMMIPEPMASWQLGALEPPPHDHMMMAMQPFPFAQHPLPQQQPMLPQLQQDYGGMDMSAMLLYRPFQQFDLPS